MRRLVVLPHPDGPTRTRNSPSSTWRFRSSTAGSLPKSLWTPSKRTSATVASRLAARSRERDRPHAVSRLVDSDGVMGYPLRVEVEAEPRQIRDAHEALFVDPQGFGKHL